uniref:Uncharacterized protein n=1 Tax=Arundo donax TaxID=35708 RepID=A0A0A9AQM5_ARUDO
MLLIYVCLARLANHHVPHVAPNSIRFLVAYLSQILSGVV